MTSPQAPPVLITTLSCLATRDKGHSKHLHVAFRNISLPENSIIVLDASYEFADNSDVTNRIRDARLRSHFCWVTVTWAREGYPLRSVFNSS